MRVRTVLIVTAVLSSILGAVVAYLVLTVPNDLQAAALMKTARKQIAAGDSKPARRRISSRANSIKATCWRRSDSFSGARVKPLRPPFLTLPPEP